MTIKYRPEIDGLRALAVIPVLIYHADFSFFEGTWFSGGFLGVDVFFVISGYLITAILLREIKSSTFSFLNFYERRARRILPPLYLVLFTSLIFAWKYLLPSDLVAYGQSVISTVFFSSNVLFWSESDYAAVANELKPLIHTWSLSVEEQFYLIFPAVLILCFKFGRKHILTVLLGILLFSFELSVIGGVSFPRASFFMIHTRAWELMAGAILARMEDIYGRRSYRILNSTMPLLGVFLLLESYLRLDDSMNLGYLSLIPIFATCLLLWFSGKGDLVTKLLSSKFLVGIGLLSYSLYLWHQPIFAFARISSPDPLSQLNKIGLMGICGILSFLSWRYVERFVRNKTKVSTKSLWLLTAFFSLLLVTAGIHIILKDGFSSRIPAVVQNASSAPINIRILRRTAAAGSVNTRKILKDSDGKECHGRAFEDRCIFESPQENKREWLWLGDSHIAALSSVFKDEKSKARKYKLAVSSTDLCFYHPGTLSYFGDTGNLGLIKKGRCNKRNEAVKNYLKQNRKTIVVIGGRLPLYLSSRFFDNKEGGLEEGAKKNRTNRIVVLKEKNDVDLKKINKTPTEIGQLIRSGIMELLAG
ncbi:MAG: acyltransferase family protein, partial [SAR324 cluster bacterium]|nr:acyltransferase family protein [SAR324 cluster bacterium]